MNKITPNPQNHLTLTCTQKKSFQNNVSQREEKSRIDESDLSNHCQFSTLRDM
jgi:hypothetical protein